MPVGKGAIESIVETQAAVYMQAGRRQLIEQRDGRSARLLRKDMLAVQVAFASFFCLPRKRYEWFQRSAGKKY